MGSCHPESDSVGRWAEPEQASARLPPSSSPARPPPARPRGASNLTATTRPPGKPDTGCSQPTSPSCQRAGRSELLALPVALPGSQVLQFSLSPRPQPHSTPVISRLPHPCPLCAQRGTRFELSQRHSSGWKSYFCRSLCLALRLGEGGPPCTPHPAQAGMRPGWRRLPAQLPEGACGLGGQPGARDRCPGLAAGSARSCAPGGHGQGRARPDSLAFSVALFFPFLFFFFF